MSHQVIPIPSPDIIQFYASMTLLIALAFLPPPPSKPLTATYFFSPIEELFISQDLTEHISSSEAFPLLPKSKFNPTFSYVFLKGANCTRSAVSQAVCALCLLLDYEFFSGRGFNIFDTEFLT